MGKLKNPLMSLRASGTLSRVITFLRRRGVDIAEKTPRPIDVRSPNQLIWRHMYSKCTALWHELSSAEKLEWESLARRRHMTGYAWFISQCLRPNPGIYLPLQGGTMSGNIDLAKNRLLRLPVPSDGQEPVTFGGHIGARVYHDKNQSIPNNTWTTLDFNSERYDTDTMHYPVVNSSRLTCKTAGKYIISINVRFPASGANAQGLLMWLNTTNYICYTQFTKATAGSWYMTQTTIYQLAVGDYVEVQVFQNSGGALNIESVGNFSPEFEMARLVS